LVQGARGLAGSLGQTLGAPGAERLESRASGFGMAAAAAAIGQSPDTRAIVAAADAGAPWANAILDTAAADLAVAFSDLQRLVDPQCVVLGGGIGLLTQFRERLHVQLSTVPARLRPTIVPAALGADAGIIGIAAYCVDQN
jgi:N-acetylmannosamine-6-phosphate 2-epimerase/N-acetylmannosamine kinase